MFLEPDGRITTFLPGLCPVPGFFPGNAIGTMEPGQAIQLLTSIRAAMPIMAAGWSPVMNWKSDCPAYTLHLLHSACEQGQ